jgi:hypothetical protein
MRNVVKILCSLMVLSGFTLAALSCYSSSSASSESSGGYSGKDGASLVPGQLETEPIQQDEKQARPEVL